MDIEIKNRPIIRGRMLISEKKKEPPKDVPKKVDNKGIKTLSGASKHKNFISITKGDKDKQKPNELKKKTILIPIKNTKLVKKEDLKVAESNKKKVNKRQQKSNKEDIKKRQDKKMMISKPKFGRNAHRAVVADRDSAIILEPKISEKLRNAILSDYKYVSTTKKTNTDTAISQAKKTVISQQNKEQKAIPPMPINGKSAINFVCEPDGDTYTSDTTGIIITMTSWPKRIKNVEKTLKTILDNNVLPEKIIINLSTEEFPNKESNLPTGLVLLAKKNPIIEFHWLKHNTTVWKKIIPTIIRFKNANVICIDDDRLYPKNFIAAFKEAASKYPSGPITGANISFHKKFKQHCGHATLDKYTFYRDGLDFITREVMDLKSSDSVLTIIANRTGHPTQYLGTNYLSLIPQNNNPVDGYSSNGKVSVSAAIKSADTLFDRYLSSQKKEEEKIDVKLYTESYGDFEITYAEIL